MLGQRQYGTWFQIYQCKNGDWETAKHSDGGETIKLYNILLAKRIAQSLLQTPGITAVMVIKVEAATVFDWVTRGKMLHTHYTGIMLETVSRETILPNDKWAKKENDEITYW